MARAEHKLFKLSSNPFFTRNNLTEQDELACYQLITHLYHGQPVSLASSQGYCSHTIFIGPSIVLQFRPQAYHLSLPLCTLVAATYPSLAPSITHLATLPHSGLELYRMTRIPGISLLDFRLHSPTLARHVRYLENLCTSLAAFLARSWHADLPAHVPLGKVGRSLESRLNSLSTSLPTRFRPLARRLLENVNEITSLPWVLTHGDLVPGNMMLDPNSGNLTGLVDWAEAEVLPFGVCFYFLEEVLGELKSSGFEYQPEAERLRALFWMELERRVDGLREMREKVMMARDIGVLLWWGIAWDEGRIDRVVEEGRDLEEIMRLDAFLEVDERLDEKAAGAERMLKL